ncbi:MAG: hypothetical protein ABI380_12610 [Edaphobacter sp.]
MKPCTLAFLYSGPNYAALSDMKDPEAFALHAKHLEGVRTNVQNGLQILAAPIITPGGKLCALGVFHAHISIEQVSEILQRATQPSSPDVHLRSASGDLPFPRWRQDGILKTNA